MSIDPGGDQRRGPGYHRFPKRRMVCSHVQNEDHPADRTVPGIHWNRKNPPGHPLPWTQVLSRRLTAESLLAGVFGDTPGTSGSLQPDPLPWSGGENAARERLNRFILENLDRYPADRNDPNAGALSCMSPYLHFGQISPVFIAQKILESKSPSAATYLEELIVRRELSTNFVHYNPRYDDYSGLPDWAKKTLSRHSADRREYSYRFRRI